MSSSIQTLSIALCTYNGEAHLAEQWESLLKQERPPDEVVVCDDCSTDNTRMLIRQLAQTAPFTVRVVENDMQLGYNKNFEKALSLCTGDLIFICDQDDYWFPHKTRVMAEYMADHPDVQIAFCNANEADENLNDLGMPFWNRIRLDQFCKERWALGMSMEVLLEGSRMMGCATVLRRPFLTQALPIPTDIPGYIYDGWISLVGGACNTIQLIDQPLQLYRTHENQQVGTRPEPAQAHISLRERFTRDRAIKLEPLARTRYQLRKIKENLSERVPAHAEGLKQLERKLRHYTMRSTLPENRLFRVWPVLRDLQQGLYHRYADSAANGLAPYLAALGDLLE
ncbi:MAG: glycosyltransferase [Cytophagales bacterium]|nr:MAG: glycosyltransferase [Cytophagales bacterium]